MPIDPHSIEIRYTFALLGYLIAQRRPTTVRIASSSPDVVTSLVRYLCPSEYTIVVESREIQEVLAESLGIEVRSHQTRDSAPDLAVFPFSLEDGMRPAGETSVVAASYNSLSYKTLLHPSTAKGTAAAKLAILRRTHQVHAVAGLFAPPFIGLLAAAKLFENGAWWRLSYVVVAASRHAD
jgi:hypothetical protein